MSEPRYPDISDILDRKAQGRLDLSRRSFGEKIEAIEALRERLRPFAALRPLRSCDAGAAGTGVLDGVEFLGAAEPSPVQATSQIAEERAS